MKALKTRFKVEKSDTTDWLQGDTITAHFDSAAAPAAKKDTTKSPTIKQLVAAGHFGAKTGKGFHSYTPKKLAAKRTQRDRQFLALLKLFYVRNTK